MLLPHHPELITSLRTPSASDPWRVVVSGCLAGWPCGVDGSDYGLAATVRELLARAELDVVAFCPEQYALGTPRAMPDIHGGDGFDVVAGRARVRDEHGNDLTAAMLDGARAMLEHATVHRAELAILTDASAACGSQVISDGCRLVELRRHRKGVGVATAMLLEAGIAVVSQRDFATLARLWTRIDASRAVRGDERDHHEHAWTLANLPGGHPRA